MSETALKVRDLNAIAKDIQFEWDGFQMRLVDQIEGRIRIGVLLAEARAQMPSDNVFGAWMDDQDFGTMSRQTRWSLRRIGENPERARIEAGVFSKDTSEVNTQKWAARMPLPESIVETTLDYRTQGVEGRRLSPAAHTELATQEWFTHRALREAKAHALGYEPKPEHPAVAAAGAAVLSDKEKMAKTAAALNTRQVKAFLDNLRDLTKQFRQLAKANTQPEVLAKFEPVAAAFAARQVDLLAAEVTQLSNTLKEIS